MKHADNSNVLLGGLHTKDYAQNTLRLMTWVDVDLSATGITEE